VSENGLAIRVAWERVKQLPEANVSPAGLIYRADVLDLLQGVADDEDRREPPSREIERLAAVLRATGPLSMGWDYPTREAFDKYAAALYDAGLRSQPASEPSLRFIEMYRRLSQPADKAAGSCPHGEVECDPARGRIRCRRCGQTARLTEKGVET